MPQTEEECRPGRCGHPPPPRDSSMAGRFSGAGGRLPIRHGVGGFATKFIHSALEGAGGPVGFNPVAGKRDVTLTQRHSASGCTNPYGHMQLLVVKVRCGTRAPVGAEPGSATTFVSKRLRSFL